MRILRFTKSVLSRFWHDDCLLHASALAYTTLLSLVPLFALMFAVLKGLGVQRRLEPLLLSRLALDAETTERIITYIDRTNVGTLGVLGAIGLIVTVVSVLGAVEGSFNAIWRVRHSRTIWRRVTDYISAVLLVPFLLLVAVAITSSAYSRAVLNLLLETELIGDAVVLATRLIPVAVNAVAIGLMYSIMPNRRPHVRSILIGALIAGALWQLVQWSYVALQFGFARYNAIYGALSQLPITLVWIYVSWSVILLGAQIAAVYEFGVEEEGELEQPASRWAVATHILLRAAERFASGGGPVDPKVLARELQIEGAAVREVADQLRDGGLLAEVEGPSFVLAQDPRTIDLALLDALVEPAMLPSGADPRVKLTVERLAKDRIETWTQRTLADLLEERTTERQPGPLRQVKS